MSAETKIEWATHTFNPWIGCTKVSPGCANCYAENTTRARVLRSHGHETWGKGKQRSRTSADYWKQPLRWNRQVGSSRCDDRTAQRAVPTLERPRVFPSLCDWLDDEVPIEWLADFLKLIHDTPNLDWLLLTKRPEKCLERLGAACKCLLNGSGDTGSTEMMLFDWLDNGQGPANVWIGASAEDQTRLDQRVPQLLKIPAAVRFLSLEPLLGPLDFPHAAPCGYYCDHDDEGGGHRPGHGLSGINWAIVGGESGPGARPCNVEWVRDIVRQCKAAGVPCFVKQLGKLPYEEVRGEKLALEFQGPKGGDMRTWPEDLRVREFPSVNSEILSKERSANLA